MRQYKVIKKKGGLDEGIVIGEFTANDDMSTLAFACAFRDFVIKGPEGYNAWHGYQAVPLCTSCGEMLLEIIVVGSGDRDLSICDKCWHAGCVGLEGEHEIS